MLCLGYFHCYVMRACRKKTSTRLRLMLLCSTCDLRRAECSWCNLSLVFFTGLVLNFIMFVVLLLCGRHEFQLNVLRRFAVEEMREPLSSPSLRCSHFCGWLSLI
eukprot:Rmarinus@m.16136